MDPKGEGVIGSQVFPTRWDGRTLPTPASTQIIWSLLRSRNVVGKLGAGESPVFRQICWGVASAVTERTEHTMGTRRHNLPRRHMKMSQTW